MFADWNQLSPQAQLALSRVALQRAAAAIALQAEVLADQMECGGLADHGGAEALRLFAAVVRVNQEDQLVPAGHA
jgi:hypothetical protein